MLLCYHSIWCVAGKAKAANLMLTLLYTFYICNARQLTGSLMILECVVGA